MSAFNGVKIFSATIFTRRQVLGEEITRWLDEMRRRPGFQIVDITVRQSSDAAFHCLTYVITYNEPSTKKRTP